MCYPSTTINVHDNKDGVCEIHPRVLLADLNGWKGSYEDEQEGSNCDKIE
jgi:hypothetical protein